MKEDKYCDRLRRGARSLCELIDRYDGGGIH